ncbi:hypothetical protein M422DRAFT_54481 [Sphaerobolus stellatus SS14]|uniref:CcmS related domain-containing protein n=1 Tax=Sphaerobolus stellatus (strain SS14) TaxID=990650 RepID=A0A0C9UIP5_SPHS4|nr:hypothetical protein M422DRAFT_54481 [Sphaerobolus stellatus SS14]
MEVEAEDPIWMSVSEILAELLWKKRIWPSTIINDQQTRIYWSFDPKKDSRVHSLLTWIGAMGHALATLGVHKFLETGERGALMANATYRHPDYQDEPCFDWVTFEDVVDTHDKILQESMAFYSPENQVLVFIFLLSESGNSMAIWRRKLDTPLHVHNQWHIDLEKTARILSKIKYVITVDLYV